MYESELKREAKALFSRPKPQAGAIFRTDSDRLSDFTLENDWLYFFTCEVRHRRKLD